MKKLFIGISAVVVIAAAGALFATRDTAATHPTLKASELPRLIPTRAFYADPRAAYDYVASGDGKYVAFTQASLTGRSIVIKDLETNDVVSEFSAGLRFLRWHPTKPLVRFIFEGNDWEADPFNPARVNWKRISPLRLSGGWIKNEIASSEDQSILAWGKSHKNDTGHMWLVSQNGLNAEKVAEGNPKTQYWVFDEQTKPVLRLDSLDPATTRLFRKDESGWQFLSDISLNDTFSPLSRVRADGTLLARSSRGRDKIALVSFDTRTAQETVLLESPDADIGLATGLTTSAEPDVIRLAANTQERVALTDRGQVFLDILAQFPQPVSLRPTVPTASGRFVTQAISSRSKPFSFILMDLEEETFVTLGAPTLHRFEDHFVQERGVTFTARDGVEVPAMLMLPKGVDGPVPFVVYIHGGPAEHVSLGYAHDAQFLVNRGYGVLFVNFRGSTGYGKEFQSRGFKEFGRAMQDDIADAALWLVDQGIADTDALVAMGISYGGYSAALAMTRDPGLFDEAIVEFPMLDVEFQSQNYPGFWDNGMDAWWRYFGKVDNPEDLELMREYSPSNRVEDLHGPVLLLGGMRDEITAVQQIKDFEASAKAAGKDVKAHYFDNAGHGVSHWRDELRRARLIEEFLAKHAGGRSGGFEFAERAPAFID